MLLTIVPPERASARALCASRQFVLSFYVFELVNK